MIIEKIGTGATVEDAFADAKALLNAPEDAELHQEIIEYPKKKLFSRVPAKIKVWYEVPDSPAEKERTRSEENRRCRSTCKTRCSGCKTRCSGCRRSRSRRSGVREKRRRSSG